MKYCIVHKRRVYSCDHYECTRKSEDTGKNYCQVYGEWVYSCDHHQCN